MTKRILVAGLRQESNAFSPLATTLQDFHVTRGSEMLRRLPVTKVFERAGFDLVPGLMAYAVPGGKVTAGCFHKLAREIVQAAGEQELAGIWLYLHGALEVEQEGSGEAILLRLLREKVGWDIPIAIALDLHANNTPELIRCANIVTGYRTAPHTDEAETQLRAASLLIRSLEQNIMPRLVMIRLPMLITGERATTGQEPMKALMEQIKSFPDHNLVWDASYFVGMAWVDTRCSGASLVAVVQPGHETAAGRELIDMANIAWAKRHSFCFEEETADLPAALRKAREYAQAGKRPVFLTDSGDNITAGAPGDQAFMLSRILETADRGVLFAGITDRRCVDFCRPFRIGAQIWAEVGGQLDSSSTVIRKKAIKLWQDIITEEESGTQLEAVVLRFGGSPADAPEDCVDVIVSAERCAFTSPQLIEKTGLRIADYPAVVVKQGYLFAALRAVAAHAILVFSPGRGDQQIERSVYDKVIRPVYPLDRDMEWQADLSDLVFTSGADLV